MFLYVHSLIFLGGYILQYTISILLYVQIAVETDGVYKSVCCLAFS
ncbi:hypothetical protein RchiOBHm_Chr2g0128731 [Rosa chinensis]|uniref:Uncharacterized protein n=1 Tax=Rosa chinensis TaxID=74649 RepID=A0A2P6RUD6_ROSCH|nr:hypothetical protein RchiOBHm_Chr2g0128731 [Rosa chinensis]